MSLCNEFGHQGEHVVQQRREVQANARKRVVILDAFTHCRVCDDEYYTPEQADRREQLVQVELDFQERLASIKRGIRHMADIGGVWPRDVDWLIQELERARAAQEEG